MPSAGRSAAAVSDSTRPSYSIRPPSSGTTPEIARNSVVLPAPLGPTIATNCPSPTSRVTSCSARRPPYDTETFSSRSIGSPALAEIRLDDDRQIDDLLRFATRQNFAVVEGERGVGEAHHRMHGVLDDDEGHAFAANRFDRPQHMLDFACAKSRQDF